MSAAAVAVCNVVSFQALPEWSGTQHMVISRFEVYTDIITLKTRLITWFLERLLVSSACNTLRKSVYTMDFVIWCGTIWFKKIRILYASAVKNAVMEVHHFTDMKVQSMCSTRHSGSSLTLCCKALCTGTYPAETRNAAQSQFLVTCSCKFA